MKIQDGVNTKKAELIRSETLLNFNQMGNLDEFYVTPLKILK
jgi:hypothetical protein